MDEGDREAIRMLREVLGSQYSEKVIDYGTRPRNCGVMQDPDAYAKVKGPCGDTVEIFLRAKSGRIVDIRYTTDGCMTSHAAVSAATEMAKGKSLRECIRVNQTAILEHLGGMPEESRHCALLAAKTLQKALRNLLLRKTLSF